jgi:uncharacterized protein
VKLEPAQTIAVFGLSAKIDRPSFDVASATQYAGSQILDETCVATLEEITERVDIVDCFRKSEDMPEVARAVVAMRELPKVLWMQQGIANDEARAIAEAAGIEVIEDRCIKIAYYSQR